MLIEMFTVDFESSEAIYMQLRNQIILGIATAQIREGDMLPSVRQRAGGIGINMHTVNKAYALLQQEGILAMDCRKRAVVQTGGDKLLAMEEMRGQLKVLLAKACCKNISREEVHQLIDEIYEEYG